MEYEGEIAKLKVENNELKSTKEITDKNYQIVLNDNHALNVKLENLENVFIGNPIQKGDNRGQQRLISDEYMASNVKKSYPVIIRKH
jgi:kinesin family protein 12